MNTQTRGTPNSREVLDQRLMRVIFASLVLLVAVVAHHTYSKPQDAEAASLAVLQEKTVYLAGDLRTGTVLENEDQELIAQFAPGEGGLLETLGTVLRRQRLRHNVTEKTPVVARLHGPRTLTLFDPATGHSYNMATYGSENIDRIVKYLIEDG